MAIDYKADVQDMEQAEGQALYSSVQAGFTKMCKRRPHKSSLSALRMDLYDLQAVGGLE
jgi:hypothetical protein